jgi:DnaJ-domain-containing protein 1
MKPQEKAKNDACWKGILFGAVIGLLAGKNWMSAGIGAVVGYNIEREMRRRKISAARYAGEAFARQAASRRPRAGGGVPAAPDPLADAYALFGLDASASDSTLKHAYRALAKKYHPDILRANGLSDEAVQKATEAMSQVNAAWSLIEKARRL